MAFKFVAIAAAFLAVAQAGIISAPPTAYIGHTYAAAPVAKLATPVVAKTVIPEPYDAHPQYNYGYGIDDHLTGDSKSAQEARDGDVVQGSYSLTDADGFRRTVDYTADPIHGFNAVVRREPLAVTAVAKVAAPVAYTAPQYATPLVQSAYAAPIAKVATYAAPAYYHH